MKWGDTIEWSSSPVKRDETTRKPGFQREESRENYRARQKGRKEKEMRL